MDNNPFKKWKRVKLKLGGHQVNHNPFKEWKKVELEPSGH